MEQANRLQLKPYRAVSEHIDGAWWPRSTNLAAELLGLVAALSDRLGQIVMVGYHRNDWHDTPPSAQIGGHAIELLGFTSDEPASVMLLSEYGRHITLHVIAPDTDEDVARQALDEARARTDSEVSTAARATVGRSVADVAEKLARHEGLGDEHRTAQIKRWCEETAQQFVDAPVQTFVPILVEHIVRNRMMESRKQRDRVHGGLRIALPGSSAPYSSRRSLAP
ncbi:MAG: hypothetical protein JOZ00_04730 [Mycobacterium sp.]|uniref:DUF5994 family protein n=1 Tax=Mycobacterium sp. TaxID=1785 RepID=UPI001EC910E2|nr:DUF5994 family protein [Mycobacterium sp.]MBV8785975.1 hypothetical protein [Mycobacterium sp.]